MRVGFTEHLCETGTDVLPARDHALVVPVAVLALPLDRLAGPADDLLRPRGL